MFDQVSNAFSGLISKFKGKGQLAHKELDKALKSTRNILLQSDVALPVTKKLIDRIKNAAVNHPSHLTPSEVLTSILKREISAILEQEEYSKEPIFPNAIKKLECCMIIGLQGAGKTTTIAKLAHRMSSICSHKPVLMSLDFSRYAAQEQLSNLAEKTPAAFFPASANANPQENAREAINFAKKLDANLLLIDTPGINQVEAMENINSLKKIFLPTETLLVLDSMTGQNSIQIGSEFRDKISLTGIILTKSDGDTRGGAALSIRYITKLPIKYIGVGENLQDLQIFHFKRIVSQILKQGDLETLKETFATQDKKSLNTEKIDMNTIREQLEQISKIGGMKKLLKLMPWKALENYKIPDETLITQSKSIIDSMTPKERANPKIINGSRKKRIAAGSGTSVVQVNRLLKQLKQMKAASKLSGKLKNNGEISQRF